MKNGTSKDEILIALLKAFPDLEGVVNFTASAQMAVALSNKVSPGLFRSTMLQISDFYEQQYDKKVASNWEKPVS